MSIECNRSTYPSFSATPAETGLFTQISGEVPPTVEKPGFFGILAIATVSLQSYSLLERDKTARKSGCRRTVRQTASRLKLCIAADRE